MSGLGMREAARVIAIDAIERVVLVRYFLVRTPVFEPVPGHTWEQLNAERVSAVRWWTIDEILGTPEALFAPVDWERCSESSSIAARRAGRSTSASEARPRAVRHASPMRVVALLRGINIGASKRIGMADLRAIVESLGHTDVETYLQSGNVVFNPKGKATRDLGPSLSSAIADATGLDVPVVTRTGAELARIVEACPYAVDDPTRVVVAFLGDEVDLGDLALGDLSTYLPDELTIDGRELYVSVPNGQARSKLMETLTKRSLPTILTVRNWRTVEALATMSRD